MPHETQRAWWHPFALGVAVILAVSLAIVHGFVDLSGSDHYDTLHAWPSSNAGAQKRLLEERMGELEEVVRELKENRRKHGIPQGSRKVQTNTTSWVCGQPNPVGNLTELEKQRTRVCRFHNLYFLGRIMKFVVVVADGHDVKHMWKKDFELNGRQLGTMATPLVMNQSQFLTEAQGAEKVVLTNTTIVATGEDCRLPLTHQTYHYIMGEVGAAFRLARMNLTMPPVECCGPNPAAYKNPGHIPDSVLFRMKMMMMEAMVDGAIHRYSSLPIPSVVKFYDVYVGGGSYSLGLEQGRQISQPLLTEFEARIRAQFSSPCPPRRDSVRLTVNVLTVSRRDNRVLLNMDSILRWTEEFCSMGFDAEKAGYPCPLVVPKLVYLEEWSFPLQLALFCDTDILLAPHSSALTNIIFMPQHASLIEVGMYGLPQIQFSWNTFKALAIARGNGFFRHVNTNYSQSRVKRPADIKPDHLKVMKMWSRENNVSMESLLNVETFLQLGLQDKLSGDAFFHWSRYAISQATEVPKEWYMGVLKKAVHRALSANYSHKYLPA